MESIRIIDIETKEIYQISLSGLGNEKKSTCPVCSKNRKKEKEKVLSYNIEKDSAFCHHCNASFVKFVNRQENAKVYQKPIWRNKTELSDKVVKYFESRKISQETLKLMKVTEGKEWMPQHQKEVDTIQFNYFLNEELINIKFRGPQKSFKLSKDAELIFYNIDKIKDSKECIIVEGEIDCLSWVESGYLEVVSVPAGANAKNTEYLDNYLQYFENKEIIYLATDNDIKGVELRNELARRLGSEKCKKVEFKQFKDSNEYLCHCGKIGLLDTLVNSKEFKIEGLFNITDVENEYFNLFNNGLKKGFTIGGEIDNYLSFEVGRLYTITGIPNHGKSNWLDFVITKLSLHHGLKFAYFSPENQPLQLHAATITEKLIGTKFDNKHSKLSEVQKAFDYIKKMFTFINPPDKFTIDNILNLALISIKKQGINGIIIDPYNKIEHQFDNKTTETNYISQLLDKLITFAIKNKILLFLVAHPRKMTKDKGGKLYEIPNLYDINGSANFYNKTDFGITVYRNMETGISEIYVQKAKFKHLGEIGYTLNRFNVNNGRYTDIDTNGDTVYDNETWLKDSENSINFDDLDDLPANLNF